MNGNTNITSWGLALQSAWQNTIASIFYFLPNLIAAIVLFVIGFILANWAKKLTLQLLKKLQLSKLLANTGFEEFLSKAEVSLKAEEIAGGLIKWLVILVFFVASVNVLGLTTVSQVLAAILAYIPRIFSAIIVLTIGILVAGLVEGLIKGALFNIDIKAARLLAKIGSYLVVIFAILTAINELGIAQVLIGTLFTGFVAMLALGLGLAIGLGSKDLVARILNDWYEDLKKELKKK
jgi:hypothetical protein